MVDVNVFLEIDLSRAEERVLLMLTNDANDRKIARALPGEFDSYRHTASRIYGIAERDVTPTQRYLGKRTTLAAQRGLGPERMVDEVSKDDVYIVIHEAEKSLRTYHAEHPGIEGHYFPDIRKQVARFRGLANSWGRIIRFDDERLNDEVYRQSYSFLPQSEVADVINQYGVVPLWKWLPSHAKGAQINATVHDSILVSCHPDDAINIAVFLQHSLERPRLYAGEPMTIPIEFKLGASWAMKHEFKRLPTRAEFTAAAWDCAS